MIRDTDVVPGSNLAKLIAKAEAKETEKRPPVLFITTQDKAINQSLFIFNLTPIGKPRMTQRDKWKNTRTKAAQVYMEWADTLRILAHEQGFVIGEGIQVVFVLPVPKSWSKTKQSGMLGKPHQSKPDADNMLKGFVDALSPRDQVIYDKHALKFWWKEGKIIVLRNEPVFKDLMQIELVKNALERLEN